MNDEIMIINESELRDKIYEVRGVKVMLDFDLAKIYGYETKAFNQQVRRNLNRFPGDFFFRLTKDDLQSVLRSQIVTSSWGGSRYLPYAFTEQGIYMLMTILKGDLAIRQSVALIRAFRAMKDYLVDNQALVTQRDLLQMSMQTAENAQAISDLQATVTDQQKKLLEHDDRLVSAFEQLSETVKKSEISPVLLQFGRVEQTEFLLLNGHPAQALK